jgi:DEAD/DEAH box helicase domain-containing protein
MDQFLMNDPEWFFGRSSEEARLDPDNPYILSDHVRCAAFELPFRDEEMERGEDPLPIDAAVPVLEYLEEDGIVRHTGGKWHWADRSYPAEGVSLRSAGADNVVIIDTTKGRNAVIGEMDRPSAKELIFENAVYMHRGRQYLVEKLDIENRKCLVVEADVNYFTDGLTKTDIKVLTEDEFFTYRGNGETIINPDPWELTTIVPAAHGVLGDVLVRSQVAKFKKIRFHTHENIGYGDINLPEEEMQTRSLVLLFGKDTLGGKALAGMDEAAAGLVLGGAGTLIRLIAPIYLLCDPRDLGIAERVRDPHFGVGALYIYDKYPGGTGLAESLARKAPELFAHVYRSVECCPCKDGCPSCVGPGGNKRGTRELLRAVKGEFRHHQP